MEALSHSARCSSLPKPLLDSVVDTSVLPLSRSHQVCLTRRYRRRDSRVLITAVDPYYHPLKPPNEVKKRSIGLPGSAGRPRLPSSMDPPALGSFKPPSLPIPGMFMPPPTMPGAPVSPEADVAKREKEERMSTLLEMVRDGNGSWQERAAAIQELQHAGYTTEKLYDATYVSYDKQTAMVVAAQVYDSLSAEGSSQAVLDALTESYLLHLYALRTLSARQRRAAVEYMLENGLDAAVAHELARAIKDHERRPLGREGFTTAPGDCLAFMLHRMATEARDQETRDRAIERAFSVVVSESARRRVQELVANTT